MAADPDIASSKILVVIPTYNEAENIEPLVASTRAALPQADLLIVDDGSPDGTGDIADTVAAGDSHVHVLHRESKMGLGTAYIAGFNWGLSRAYQFLCEMDADFSHDPQSLPSLVEAATEGVGLAIGSRYVPGGKTVNWGLMRKIISRGGNIYAKMILGVSQKDITSGFRCFRREALEAIDLASIRSEGYAFQIEMAYRVLQAQMTVAELPIVFVDRRVGQSKMSEQIFWEAALGVWRLKLRRKRS